MCCDHLRTKTIGLMKNCVLSNSIHGFASNINNISQSGLKFGPKEAVLGTNR